METEEPQVRGMNGHTALIRKIDGYTADHIPAVRIFSLIAPKEAADVLLKHPVIVSIHSGIFGARFYVLHHMCCENKTSHFLLLGMGAFLSVGDTVSLLPPLPYNLYAFLLPPALFA